MKENTLVKFDFDSMPDNYRGLYPFRPEDRFVYLGDIVQMPGHCVVVRISDSKVFCCYHTDDFAEVPEEEC
jgi:hypothetical protein